MIIDALEKRLVEALKSVDAHGDVAPAHVHDPMTMLLRANAVQANLMRWDDGRGRYVLTGTGRRRISAGSLAPGTVVSFVRVRRSLPYEPDRSDRCVLNIIVQFMS